MSRIIVKNLPKTIKEERVRKVFGVKGSITDCSLKFSKDGVFRRFAFIGYSSEKEAEDAVKHFHKTFIDTARLQVEIARELGDENQPRPWSKYSKGSSAHQHIVSKLNDEGGSDSAPKKKSASKKEKKQKQIDELLADVKDDADFQEFLEVNKAVSQKALWGNDGDLPTSSMMQDDTDEMRSEAKIDKTSKTSQPEEDMQETDEEAVEDSGSKGKTNQKVKKTEETASKMSDMEYLKSKMKKTGVFSDSDSDSDSNSESSESEEEQSTGKEKDEEDGIQDKIPPLSKEHADSEYKYLVKMKGVPPHAKPNQVKDFFKPISVKNIKIPQQTKASKAQKIVTVEFANKSDQELALRRNKNFIGPKRIFLHKVIEEVSQKKFEKPRTWELNKANDEEEETIAESGRLYVRNLAYCCKEEELEKLFSKYGPLSEIHLPIDTFTKKIKGFAFISFMFPEHAVRAFTELDGKSWQGRILHILPSKGKKAETEEAADTTSYKKKKEAEQKASAGSSHNWNTLFLGSNAVVDTMAAQYGADKSHILGVDGGKESIGVRLALGETQVVAETRDFLLDSGVVLDAFSQPGAERSKTVILVKNLPAQTKAETLRDLFGRHGTLGRVVLPPSGLSAIVEFMEPTEARTAFRSLAYTKFQHVPLYLEWAPMGVFATPAKSETSKADNVQDETDEDKDREVLDSDNKKEKAAEESDDEAEESEGCTLFVKNLNFDTEEESLRDVFAKCGKVKSVQIAKKKDIKHPGQYLSMGYGFVEYCQEKFAKKAMKTLQHTKLDGHQLELKVSHRATQQQREKQMKKGSKHKASTKILVRNLPFEAKQEEIKELFAVFGELKTVRLPRKLSGKGQHRGFGFVDFLSKEDAKRAFKALCHSTHLYGRRLVLEWAAPEETLDELRLRTATRFHHGEASPSKKLKKSSLLDELKLTDAD